MPANGGAAQAGRVKLMATRENALPSRLCQRPGADAATGRLKGRRA